jgi:hypothetical protein
MPIAREEDQIITLQVKVRAFGKRDKAKETTIRSVLKAFYTAIGKADDEPAYRVWDEEGIEYTYDPLHSGVVSVKPVPPVITNSAEVGLNHHELLAKSLPYQCRWCDHRFSAEEILYHEKFCPLQFST